MTEDEMIATFERQHALSRAEAAPDAEARRRALTTLEKLLLDNGKAIAAAISEDFRGRARAETELLEVVPTARGIRHARRKVARWMRPERRSVDLALQPARAWVRYEPVGVVGIISPWNYPVFLAFGPLCNALAAGSRAMIKPSELTPAFCELLKRLIAEHFAPEQVAVVTGGVETAQKFSSLAFDHLLFTGSTKVGRQVMQAAAKNLTPVTLELGGKSPAIVAPGYPIDKAARSIASGKFSNAGQTCIAPDYALAPAGSVEDLAKAVLARAKKSYPDIADNEQYTSIVSDRHRQRLVSAIDEAAAAGATVMSHEPQGDNSPKIAPTVVIGAPTDGVLMSEEIFGPVLPIIPYETLEEAIAFVTARDRPLALYLFSNDHAEQEKVLSGAISGGVTLNGTLLHAAQDSLPFGGIGPSGVGAYHGLEGFRRFSHVRGVHKVGFINMFERVGPPWGWLSSAMGRFLSRY